MHLNWGIYPFRNAAYAFNFFLGATATINVRKLALMALGLAGGIAIIAAAIWLWSFLGPGGYVEGKAIFATLQGLEVSHRHENFSTPEVFGTYKKTGPVIVVSTFDKSSPYAWIAATVSSCDGELCMVGGDARIALRCSDVARLETQIVIVQPVKALLRNACHDQ